MSEGLDYDALSIRERLLLIRFRCATCGARPIYFLNVEHINKPRCMICGHTVPFKSRGKYGKIRKKIVFTASKMMKSNLSDSKIDDVMPPIKQLK